MTEQRHTLFIVHGPQGCGKTLASGLISRHFKADVTVDSSTSLNLVLKEIQRVTAQRYDRIVMLCLPIESGDLKKINGAIDPTANYQIHVVQYHNVIAEIAVEQLKRAKLLERADFSNLEDRMLANMSSEQLAAMASNKPIDFYSAGVITQEKADATLKQFRENHPEIAQLWPTPRKAVLPRTTGHKMPPRYPRDRKMPMVATVFSGEDGKNTLRIENGICTEVEMSITKPFTLRLVALLISHFDITPADIANETRLCGFDKEPGEA